MSLIKFEEYTGSIIGQTVEDALEMLGIINKLNINGYTLTVTGIQSATPKGMIDDTPTKHSVTFERNMFIQDATKSEFRRLQGNVEDILKAQECADIEFASDNEEKIHRGISRDEAGHVWYKHKVEFQVDQLAVETSDKYANRLFETIANYVIKAFEAVQ